MGGRTKPGLAQLPSRYVYVGSDVASWIHDLHRLLSVPAPEDDVLGFRTYRLIKDAYSLKARNYKRFGPMTVSLT